MRSTGFVCPCKGILFYTQYLNQRLYLLQHFEVAFDGWRPLLSDNEMINIGDCVGNCQASKFLDYR